MLLSYCVSLLVESSALPLRTNGVEEEYKVAAAWKIQSPHHHSCDFNDFSVSQCKYLFFQSCVHLRVPVSFPFHRLSRIVCVRNQTMQCGAGASAHSFDKSTPR